MAMTSTPMISTPLMANAVRSAKEFIDADGIARCRVAASLPARSAEGARTDSLPATAAPQQIEGKSTAFDLGFFDLRRCSTADQSGLPDFMDSGDGH